MNRDGLLSFIENLEGNCFNELVFEQTERLQKKLNKIIEEYIEEQNKINDKESSYLHLDTEFYYEKLIALSEMNIVYAYKDFEINLKKLIGAAYGVDTKQFYKWETIMKFLKLKGINPSSLEGFQQVSDLKNINNHIKHSVSPKIDKSIKSIPEFSKEENIEYDSLNQFYKRIKNAPLIFLDSISSEVDKDLYEFDSDKLRSIAEEMALRMDEETAMELIKELRRLY